MTIDNTTFYNQTLYTINVTLSGQYLVNGLNYYVNVLGTDDNGAINSTSEPVKARHCPFRKFTLLSSDCTSSQIMQDSRLRNGFMAVRFALPVQKSRMSLDAAAVYAVDIAET